MSNIPNNKKYDFLDSVNKEEDCNQLIEYIDGKITEMNKVKEAIDASVVELNKAKQAYDESKVAFSNVAQKATDASTNINKAVEDAKGAPITIQLEDSDMVAVNKLLENHLNTIDFKLKRHYVKCLNELEAKAKADRERYKGYDGMWLGPYVWIIYTFFFLCGVVYVWWTVLNAITK